MASLRRFFAQGGWATITSVVAVSWFGLTGSAYALSIVSIGPASATEPTKTLTGSGPVTLDSGVVTFSQGTFSGRAYADDVTGTLRAYGFADEVQNGAYNSVPQPVQGFGSAGLTGILTLAGPGPGPVEISLIMDFDGKFSGSNPGNILMGQIIATRVSAAGASGWTSALSFQQVGSEPVLALPVAGKSLPNSFNTSFAEGTPTVFSSMPDSLQGRVIVPLVLSPGDSFSLQVDLQASGGAHGDGCAPMTYCGHYNSIADGYSTGQLSFGLPTGYSLQGEGGAFGSVPVVSTTPEPETYALMLVGVALLIARSNRLRQA